jgi:hypothetical protein
LLNSYGWRLATEAITKGRVQELALLAGEALRRCPTWPNPTWLDTFALLAFEHGLAQTALACEREAMKGGYAGSDGGYPARCKQYEEACEAKARQAARETK